MQRLVIEVTDEMDEQLRDLAKAGDRTLSAEVRKALAAYLEKASKR